ncbi:MAG: cysteine hydrolase [Spirochaetes bacterium]|nr:MAG: cysteine hydrolase [Spirochaetota bacterium]
MGKCYIFPSIKHREDIMEYLWIRMPLIMSIVGFVAMALCPAVSRRDWTGKASPGKTALLIIDIQNDYFPGGRFELFEAVNAADVAKLVLARFRSIMAPLIHVRHESDKPGAPFFVPGTPGAEINSAVTPAEGETVIIKHEPSSFIGTPLEDILRKNGVTYLMIVGMQSNVCVKSTALDAVKKNYAVTVVEDAIAARSGEIHKKAVAEMKTAGVEIVVTDSVR